MPDAILMTPEALAAVEAELQRLETDARREIAERIRVAREWGDLKENSEYHDAKNDQAHLETKIKHLREQLLAAEVRDAPAPTDVVGFGSRVEVEDAAPGRRPARVRAGGWGPGPPPRGPARRTRSCRRPRPIREPGWCRSPHRSAARWR